MEYKLAISFNKQNLYQSQPSNALLKSKMKRTLLIVGDVKCVSLIEDDRMVWNIGANLHQSKYFVKLDL